MSYILEALKKAQAERQLGNAPTIHAPQVAPVTPAARTDTRKPLLVGLGAGALCVAAGALFLWRSGGEAARAPAASAQVAAAGAAPGNVAVATPAAPAPAVATTLEVIAPPAPPPPAPRAVEKPQRDVSAPAPYPAPEAAPVHQSGAVSQAAAPTPGAAPAAAAASPVRAPLPEDSLPLLQQLPDATQREMPRVSFGGYMYSANPADRLLLVDKALRHEGEEVAPGLVLEKLLPKAAVMNYRGVRYRVGL